MDVAELPLVRPAHDPQDARHGAPTRGKDGADQQKLGVPPGAVDE
jgi:hypothetical protein